MLTKNETKVLMELLSNYKEELTLSGISRRLKQKYPQTHLTVESLLEKGLIRSKTIGKNKMLNLDLSGYHPEYIVAEIEREKKILRNKTFFIITKRINEINKQFIAILFGSHAEGKNKKNSDIDLLFIIPNEYDLSKFEKQIKNQLSLYELDINIINEENLFEMWSKPNKLNLGNEILKKHIILKGTDDFLNLVRKHYAE